MSWVNFTGTEVVRLYRKLIILLGSIGTFSFGMAVVAATELGLIGPPRFHGTVYADAPPAPAFELTSHSGGEVSLASLRGRPVLLFFGFTRCPDVCPLTLARLQRVFEESGIDESDIAVVLITVDPDHDSPEVLAAYVRQFGSTIIGLTGSADELQRVMAEYGVFARELPTHDGAPTLAHTTQIFGIDGQGRLRVLLNADEPLELVQRDIRALLRISH
jgi:protein SCO1/2